MPLQAIILAAGSSQRFSSDKLLQVNGSSQCLLDICFDQATQLTDQVLVIIRNNVRLYKHCQQHHYPYLVNMQSASGMASSIVTGITATSNAEAWAIFLADMPGVHSTTLHRLANSWRQHEITLPVWQGQAGHPVIFSSKYRNALTSLQGDTGARSLLCDNPDVYRLETDDKGVCFDIDTDADWTTWIQKQTG